MRNIRKILAILLITLTFISCDFVFADDAENFNTKFDSDIKKINDIDPSELNQAAESDPSVTSINKATRNIWETIRLIAQIAATAAIVFAGVRYMFASADDRADIKTQTAILILGAVFVFSSIEVIKFIANAIDSTLPAP